MGSTEAMQSALTDVVARGDFTVPPYPAVALRLQRLLARPNYGVAEVAEIIAADPALAATVLGAANSAVFGSTNPITTLARAVNRLGARTVGSIAIAAGLGASATSAGVLFDVKYRVWRRSVTCALACQKLAPARGLDAEEAFLAGLLHGFGRSVAVTSLEELLKTHQPPRPLSVGEWLGIAEQHRSKLAQAVAERWQLPEVIAQAMLTQPGMPSDGGIGELLLDADQLAASIDAGQMPESRLPKDASTVDALVAGLPAALEALAAPSTAPPRASPAVAKPERALEGEARKKAISIVDRRAKAAATLTCLSLSPSGLEVESSRPFQESSVVRLSLSWGTTTLDPWLNVVLCVPNGSKYRVELQLFSPTRETKDQWQTLYGSS